MKVKELKRTVNVSWSPAEQYPVYLAAGSAAQQVDASFSSNSYLEIYSLNLEDPGLDLELKSSLQTQQKFQKIVWSGAGVIVGGCDGGLIQFYSSEKLLSNSSESLIGSSSKHNGHVSALDINPYQKNLLASGASDSEILIWDLNNTSQPMEPGNRSQPFDHVQGLAWNQQVQHILGSSFASRCVVWDLRKNEPIMKLSDSQSRTRWRALAWHPSVATQLCIASEDDQVPLIQLWDLRLAASPLVTLEGHHKGAMAVSWCKQDPGLLLSAGKDGRVLCWNPENTQPGGELLCEVSQQQQWVFDVAWCPRDPALLVSASFDQHVAVHSLLGGGSRPEVNSQNASNIMDSFGGAVSFSQLPAVQRTEPQSHLQASQFPRAPKWLKRSVSAKFAFGGKLVTFEKCQEPNTQRLVYISQVVSEPEIIEKAAELDAVLSSCLSQDPSATEQLAEYCRQKGDNAMDQNERYMWYFLRANFMPTFRSEVLNLLGFKQDDIVAKFKGVNLSGDAPQQDTAGLSRGESTETEAELSTDTSTDLSDAHTLIERKLASVDVGPSVSDVVIPNGEDSTSLICRALIGGNLEEAVELCLESKRIADALIIASLGSQELLYKVQKYHLNSTASDPVSLLAGSVLASRWDSLVTSAAASNWKDVLAALLTHCDGEALAHYCEMLGDKLSQEKDLSLKEASTVCYMVGMNAEAVVWRVGQRGGRGDVTSLARRTELALLARRAALARGSTVQSGGKLETVLTEFASRLASQGCLQSALNTLEGVQDKEMRERLMRALGMIADRNAQSGRSRGVSQSSQGGPQPGAHHAMGHRRSLAHGNVDPPPYSQAAPSERPFQYNTPPPAAQPARPCSTGPSAGGFSSRPKYKIDPSVQNPPQYNQYSFNNPSSQYGYSNNYNPLPDQYNNASVPNPAFAPLNPAPVNPPLMPGIQNASVPNPAIMNPSVPNPGIMNPNVPNPAIMNPSVPNPGVMNPNVPNPGIMNPSVPNQNPNILNPSGATVNGGYYPGSEPAPPSKPAPPGWNDPPMMTSSKHKGMYQEASHSEMSALHAGTRKWGRIIEHNRHLDEPKQEMPAQAPITHPLFGVEPPQHVPLQQQYPGQQYNDQQYPGQQQYQGQQTYQEQQYPGQQYQNQQQYPAQYSNQQYQSVNQYPPQAASPAPVEAAPVQKAPLPEQFAGLQTVFDSIRAQCADRAVNPQMKRKLEDVQKRLEILYDMLREYRLSESALTSLQTCASQAQSADYTAATNTATALATGSDFASVASFLPGLKVLFQIAQQLQVYVQ